MVYTLILYNSIIIFSTFFIFLSDKVRTRIQKKTCLVAAFLIVFIPAAIRYRVGVDLTNYEFAFYQIKLGVDTRFEFGFYILNYGIGFLGLGFEWLIAFISMITYFFLFKLYATQKNSWVIHFLFMAILYLYTFSNIRSGIIYVIMFLSIWRYINKKDLFFYFISVAVAVSLHKTAIIYLIIPILFSKNIVALLNRKYVAELLLVILTVILFQPTILHTVLFDTPLTYMLGFEHYVNSEWGAAPESGSGLGGLGKMLPLILFVIFRNYFYQRDPRAQYIVVLCLLSFFCVDLMLAVRIAHRFDKYFTITYILVLYFFYFYNPFKNLKVVFFLVYLCFYLLFFNLNIVRNDVGEDGTYDDSRNVLMISPYITIFNKEDSSIK